MFIAVDLSDEARTECASHIESIRGRFPKDRIGWEQPAKLHITIKFLGGVEPDRVTQLEDGLTQAASGLTLSVLQLGGPGVFPNKNRPRVLWIGAKDPMLFARSSLTAVEKVCRTIGFDEDDRTFTPHITIGRVRDPGNARDAVVAHLEAQIKPIEFEASSLVLYESKLHSTGSVYSVVSRFPV